jgi:hypothetical protein
VPEKWRRCARCRKIHPVEEFTETEDSCRTCLAAVAAPRSRREDHGGSRGPAVALTRGPVAADLRGRGDPEVRARRARSRALERLSQLHPVDFAHLLAEERALERL